MFRERVGVGNELEFKDLKQKFILHNNISPPFGLGKMEDPHRVRRREILHCRDKNCLLCFLRVQTNLQIRAEEKRVMV